MARLNTSLRAPTRIPYALNEQIRQLQQQMAEERVLQQQRRQQLGDVLTDRLTSWPVLLSAVAAGVMLRQINAAGQVPAEPPITATTQPTAVTSPENSTCSSVTSATPTVPPQQPFWSRLLSLPLLTQSIWWLSQQLWQSRLFRDLVRQKLIKSDRRHPPY